MYESSRGFIETPADSPEAIRHRRARLVRLNVHLIPWLRLVGFALLTVGVLLHNAFILGQTGLDRILPFVGWSALYVAVSWLLLARFYDPSRRLSLGFLFLVFDVFVFTAAIYVAGGERSLLFFILTARVADQVHSGFRRALFFSHFTTACYLAMLAWIAFGDGRSIDWGFSLTLATFLYGSNLYVALSARPSDRLRGRNRDAVRYARELIARLRKSGRELEEARRRAEEANDAKSRFLANTGHELRTPLHTVIGAAELLRSTELGEEQKDLSQIIARASGDLLQTIEDVLCFSALESGSLRLAVTPCDVRSVVDAALSRFRQEAEEAGLALERVFGDGLPDRFPTDPQRLEQILVRLLSNGLKFTETGGVKVTVEPAEDGSLLFSVADTGIGMEPEVQATIFEPFTQGDSSHTRRHAGTGLGLSTCLALVDRLGGRLEVESEPGGGSVFSFTLPPLEVKAALGPDGDGLPATTVQGRVLVVEDNRVNLELVSHQLQAFGLEVAAARDGREALGLLRREDFDLVFMDVQMPEMDGYAVTVALRSLEIGTGRHTPVVALTAHGLESDRRRCFAAGMDGHIAKPASLNDLRRSLMRWLPMPALDGEALKRLTDMGRSRGRDLAVELSGAFQMDAPKRLDGLRRALAEEDLEQSAYFAHSLKGSSLTLGAPALAKTAQEVEDAARAGSLAETRRLFPRLQTELRRALKALATFQEGASSTD